MIQIRDRGRTLGAQAFAMAAVVVALVALAAAGGYEIGSSRAQSHSFVAQPSTVLPAAPAAGTTQNGPPTTGFQP
jgi:hypothetical protein